MARRPIRRPAGAGPLVRRLAVRGLAGVVLAAATVALDQVVAPLPLAVSSARVLLSVLGSAVVTAGVFSLWMRTVVIGLVSDHFSPRTLVVFLDDRFQVRLAGWMLGALVVEVILLASMPGDDAAGAPTMTVLVGSSVALLTFGAVLYAVTHAVHSLDLTRLVSRLADEVRRVARRQPSGVSLRPPEVGDADQPVGAPSAGWVTDIDRDAILAALADGGRARLLNRVGDFVAVNQPMVVCTRGADEDAIRDAIRLDGATRSTDDVGLALSQLVDVADHSLSQSGADTATAHEALLQLSAVCCELLEQGLPPCHLHDEDRDRWLVDEGSWDVTDHLEASIERLRGSAAADPLGARHLAGVLSTLRDHAEEVGDDRAAAAMRQQLRHLWSLAEAAGAIEEDLAGLRESSR